MADCADFLYVHLSSCPGRFHEQMRTAWQVSDIDQMCLLVDALRPDESREVYTRRGLLNVVNPLFADRYYRLDLSVWDEREMSKFLIRLVRIECERCCGQAIAK